MTTPESWILVDTPPSSEPRLITTAVLNANIEVEQYVQLPNDQGHSVSDPITVRRSFLSSSDYSLAVYVVQTASVSPISEYL